MKNILNQNGKSDRQWGVACELHAANLVCSSMTNPMMARPVQRTHVCRLRSVKAKAVDSAAKYAPLITACRASDGRLPKTGLVSNPCPPSLLRSIRVVTASAVLAAANTETPTIKTRRLGFGASGLSWAKQGMTKRVKSTTLKGAFMAGSSAV